MEGWRSKNCQLRNPWFHSVISDVSYVWRAVEMCKIHLCFLDPRSFLFQIAPRVLMVRLRNINTLHVGEETISGL